METLFEDILTDNDHVLVTMPSHATVITFSNTGRGGKRNWFAMTSDQLRGCLEDIHEALDQFPSVYEEKRWRNLFNEFLTDDVARTMGSVQTLPLFEVLAKIIHFSGNSGPRSYKTINLEPNAVKQAISLLSKQ